MEAKPTISRLELYYLLTALLLTLYMFYLYEGYCDFRWMKSFGNWIVYVIYSIVIFGILLFLRYLFTKMLGIRENISLLINGVLVLTLFLYAFSNTHY